MTAWPRPALCEISGDAPLSIVRWLSALDCPLSGSLEHPRQKAALARAHCACQMASRKIARATREQQRVVGCAWVEGEGASGAEAAARRNVNGVRRLALQQIGLGLVGLLFDHRNRAEQLSRIGVPGIEERRLVRRKFDDAPEIHDGDAIAYTSHHAEVM